jgi:hypothetical protein
MCAADTSAFATNEKKEPLQSLQQFKEGKAKCKKKKGVNIQNLRTSTNQSMLRIIPQHSSLICVFVA